MAGYAPRSVKWWTGCPCGESRTSSARSPFAPGVGAAAEVLGSDKGGSVDLLRGTWRLPVGDRRAAARELRRQPDPAPRAARRGPPGPSSRRSAASGSRGRRRPSRTARPSPWLSSWFVLLRRPVTRTLLPSAASATSAPLLRNSGDEEQLHDLRRRAGRARGRPGRNSMPRQVARTERRGPRSRRGGIWPRPRSPVGAPVAGENGEVLAGHESAHLVEGHLVEGAPRAWPVRFPRVR